MSHIWLHFTKLQFALTVIYLVVSMNPVMIVLCERFVIILLVKNTSSAAEDIMK